DNVGIFRIMGQSDVVFRADRGKCDRWGVSVADVNNVIDTAVRGKALTQLIEGEKLFDVTLRWPQPRRDDLTSILDIPVDVSNNNLASGSAPSAAPTPLTGASTAPPPTGTGLPLPALPGSTGNAAYNTFLPRVPLRQLVSPVGADGRPDPSGSFV